MPHRLARRESVSQNRARLSKLTVIAIALSISFAASGPQMAAAKVQSLTARACRTAVYVSIEMDNSKDAAPGVGWVYQERSGSLKVLSSRLQPSGKDTHIIYEYF